MQNAVSSDVAPVPYRSGYNRGISERFDNSKISGIDTDSEPVSLYRSGKISNNFFTESPSTKRRVFRWCI